MNVLLISLRADVGGGPKHVYQLLENADSQLVNYFIAAPNDEPFGSLFVRHCGADKFIEMPHRHFSLTHLLALVRFCRRHNIAVVHSHGKGAGIYSRLLKVFCPAIRVVHTFHGVHIGQYGRLALMLYSGLEFALSLLTNTIIAVSDSERDNIHKLLFSCFSNKIKIIKNGVSVPERVPVKPSVASGKLNIVVVSRFDYQKNTDLLVDILSRLTTVSTCIECCYILGDGEDRHKVLQLQTQPLGYRLECPGAVLSPQEYYMRADIILNTSRWEGLSLGVLEAMAFGVIPIVSNVIGNCDIFSVREGGDKYGYLFALHDPQVAVNFIHSLWENNESRAGFSLASNALIKEKYNEQVMVLNTTRLYI